MEKKFNKYFYLPEGAGCAFALFGVSVIIIVLLGFL